MDRILDCFSDAGQTDYQFGVINRTHVRDYLLDHAARFAELVRLTRLWSPGKRVAEIGPAYGATLLSLQEDGYEVTALEFPDNVPVYSEPLLRAGIPVQKFDCHKGGLSGDFDLVICSEVVEHLLLGLPQALGSIAPLLRKGGRLVLTTPNFFRAGNFLWVLQGRNPQESHPDTPRIVHGRVVEVRVHPRGYVQSEVVAAISSPPWRLLKVWGWQGSTKTRWADTLLKPVLCYTLLNVLFAVAEKTQ
jgi:SAM-dependent methyltransferase